MNIHAFPLQRAAADPNTSGMTPRDYFAAAALPVVAMPSADGSRSDDPARLACWAYDLADEMLKRRIT